MTVIEQRSVRHGMARHVLAAVFIVFCLGVILYRVRWYYLDGGDTYLQLDWLINSAGGPVRRGFSGDFAMAASRLFGVDALLVVIVLQGIANCALIVASGLVAWRYRFHDRALLLLLAPGYISYLIYMTPGALRKEVLGYLAFLPLLVTPKNDIRALIWMGLAFLLYVLSLAFHEGNAFLLPFFGFAMLMRIRQMQSHQGAGIGILALSGGAAVAAMLFAKAYPNITDLDAVCSALMAHGVSAELCYSGIMLFLTSGNAGNALYGLTVWEEMNPASFFAACIVCLLPFVMLFQASPNQRRDMVVTFGSAVFILPLFVMGLDWGRWVLMYTISVTLVIWVYMDTEKPEWFAAPLPSVWGPLVVLLGLCFGIQHYPSELVPGVLPEFIDVVGDKVFGL